MGITGEQGEDEEYGIGSILEVLDAIWDEFLIDSHSEVVVRTLSLSLSGSN